jgi:hypothetical protein
MPIVIGGYMAGVGCWSPCRHVFRHQPGATGAAPMLVFMFVHLPPMSSWPYRPDHNVSLSSFQVRTGGDGVMMGGRFRSGRLRTEPRCCGAHLIRALRVNVIATVLLPGHALSASSGSRATRQHRAARVVAVTVLHAAACSAGLRAKHPRLSLDLLRRSYQ